MILFVSGATATVKRWRQVGELINPAAGGFEVKMWLLAFATGWMARSLMSVTLNRWLAYLERKNARMRRQLKRRL